ncbi:MAG: hypothetical protein IKG89_07480 [Oscillospiraceae bacterium]|nr:hypothetical protein [Oscillospiraceae bacterium]
MDDAKKGRLKEMGFENWLANVFWVYYKWYFFLGVLLLTILVLTVISVAGKDRTNLRVTYVYAEVMDQAQAETVRGMVEARAVPENGRGVVRVKVEPFPLVNGAGERLLYGELEDPDRIIYLLDEASLGFYQAMGYFDEAERLPGMELWISVRDTPVILYRLEDFADQGYTQEQIDESNEFLIQRHGQRIQAARELVKDLLKG